MLEKILENENVKKATHIDVSFFGENGKIAFLTVEVKNPRRRGIDVVSYSYRLLGKEDKKEGVIFLKENIKKVYPETGLTDENILDKIIEKEKIKVLSSLYIS